jgi:hypothetical protein
MGFNKDRAIELAKDAALDYHLTGNLYPPITQPGFHQFAREAITMVSSGNPDDVVEINFGGQMKNLTDNETGLKVTAIEIVNNWRLHDFIGSEEDESGDTGLTS